VAPEAIAAARHVIGRQFGPRYLPHAPRKYSAKAKNAQEAHEAVRPTDLSRLPKGIAGFLEPDQAKLYDLIWTRTIASQMESAELERTVVDIHATVGTRRLDLRATGQVIRFDGFLALYQEGRDDEDDEESGRLPTMAAGDPLQKERIESTQHFTEPPPRYTEATLVKRMEELGIGRPSTYASTLAVLREREYVRLEKKRLIPEDKGRLVTAFLESFFARYVEYDFTADLEEKLDLVSNREVDWKQVLRDFWRDFSAALAATQDLRTGQILESLNELLGPHIFPAKSDGSSPRTCPSCGSGQLSLKLGKFGAFIGCSNYPECKYTRTLASGVAEATNAADGERPGARALGSDPETGQEVSLRDGRFGAYVQLGEGEKPKRSSLPPGLAAEDLTLDKALQLLSLPREIAKHPTTREPILAGIGRYGPYVQHGKTFANLSKDEDVLTIGPNRAIDLIVGKESGSGRGAAYGRELGEHPRLGGQVTVKAGRFGPYVNHGKLNATLPRGMDSTSVTLAQAVELLDAKQAGAPTVAGGRILGEHPNGGVITAREGRYGPYVNHGKVNATLPKSIPPDAITLEDAIRLIDAKGGDGLANVRTTKPKPGSTKPKTPAAGKGNSRKSQAPRRSQTEPGAGAAAADSKSRKPHREPPPWSD
ncbi:MAG: topoisomerase DNA-binding C4 zinc finger domain-containing protein, partial [Methylobacteriaceae bacterium]|nr:topoisomerase DNA-binding C4 zinc finger domain-containing protein [Methylobacteriaceae bacterium]MBV9245511.1 topoisomerase DNA-binding C4 zinc finger domain-containing protein [Methylobacteriaceae bacterium]